MDRKKLAASVQNKITGAVIGGKIPEELFYNGNKLLSMTDINRKVPSLYFVCGNRTAGKTFYFKRWMVRRWLRFGEKFVVFVRYIDDIPNRSQSFWADIGPICFTGMHMTQRPLLNGKAAELLLNGLGCGYIIAINSSNKVRENSPLFADAVRGFLDEFMTETNEYVPSELIKFNSLRISIARGGSSGAHARYFPVYMCSNNVTVFNPYFTYFKIGTRITNRTRYLRGPGWVLEQTFNEAAAQAIKDQFGNTMSEDELKYATENKYLLDTNKFVKRMSGNRFCVAVIMWAGGIYGIWCHEYAADLYVSHQFDPACSVKFSVVDGDHGDGDILLGNSDKLVKTLRKYYNNGRVYFRDGTCRNAFISAFGIK